MNFINKIMCITALFAIGSASAKQRGAGKAPAKPAPGAPAKSAPRKPAAQVQTYKQLHDYILRMAQGNVFAGNSLKYTFIDDIAKKSVDAGIGPDGLTFLLQTARDKFAPFTGDDGDDLKMLLNLNTQIDRIVQGAYLELD